MKFFLMAVLAFSLTACAGAVPWNAQNYAGITEWKLKYKKNNDGNFQLASVTYVNGKEFGADTIKIALPDGSILNFSAEDVKAFQGQEVRARVEQAVAEQFGEVAPGVVDAILKAIIPGTD